MKRFILCNSNEYKFLHQFYIDFFRAGCYDCFNKYETFHIYEVRKRRREKMGKEQTAAAVPKQSLGKRVMKHWEFYVLLLPGIILTIIYKYWPIYGVQIAFRDYNAMDGFFGSKWVGLEWFRRFFTNFNSARMIRNTVLLSFYSILWTFPIPIILALLINQVKLKKFQRVSQTVLYAPHFISVMILCGMLRIFLSPYGGLISMIAQAFGAAPTNYIDSASAFRTIYIASSIWQDAGWGTIITWRRSPAWTHPCMRRPRWTAPTPSSGCCTSISRSWSRSSSFS